MLTGEHTGIYFVDSTKLAICHNKRTSSNRVFKRIAKGGVSSYGYFLGFKLHLIINNKRRIFIRRFLFLFKSKRKNFQLQMESIKL